MNRSSFNVKFSFILFSFLILFSLTNSSSKASPENPPGYRLLVYYGTPEGVNNLWNPEKAAKVFSQYDYIVFGDELEFPDNVHNASTMEVVQNVLRLKPTTKIFGYVDLGVTTVNLSMTEIKKRIDQWKDAGVNGIFLDDAGYDYRVSRARLNEAVNYTHKAGMPVFINAWRPSEVMSRTVHKVYNPKGEKTSIGSKDYYLLEDFLQPTDITNAKAPSAFTKSFRSKMDEVLYYRTAIGVKLLSVSTIDYEAFSTNAVRKFFRMNEATAAVFSLDGYGIAPVDYSAAKNSEDVVREFPYIKNYMDYYEQKLNYKAKADNKDFSSRSFRIHSETGLHFYQYPKDVQY